jgi:hypothetical protein
MTNAGTNVMIRARAAFMACRFDENPHGHETMRLPGQTQKVIKETLGGEAHRQLFSEVLVAEDIDLGSRVHTLGFKFASHSPSQRLNLAQHCIIRLTIDNTFAVLFCETVRPSTLNSNIYTCLM